MDYDIVSKIVSDYGHLLDSMDIKVINDKVKVITLTFCEEDDYHKSTSEI